MQKITAHLNWSCFEIQPQNWYFIGTMVALVIIVKIVSLFREDVTTFIFQAEFHMVHIHYICKELNHVNDVWKQVFF